MLTGFFFTLYLVGAKVHVSSFTVGSIFRCFFPRDFNDVLTLNATLFFSTIVYHFFSCFKRREHRWSRALPFPPFRREALL